jgi:hypothetical protein
MLAPILEDDRLTGRLDDAEARMLIEWLVERADRIGAEETNGRRASTKVRRLCRHARAIAQFVVLWCYEGSASAALQFAATERLGWPLPTGPIEPCDLLSDILAWEEK